MANARPISSSTLQFLLADTGGLDTKALVLPIAAALASDGHFQASRDFYRFAQEQGIRAAELREAIYQAGPIAGLFRVKQALEALAGSAQKQNKTANAFDALMGGGGGGAADPEARQESEALREDVDEPEAIAAARLEAVHCQDAGAWSKGLRARSETLAAWIERELYGRQFGRSRLDIKLRTLIAIGALYPLELADDLAAFVAAARHQGQTTRALWHLHQQLARMFQGGRVSEVALRGFEKSLGKKPSESFAPGKDPFRWD